MMLKKSITQSVLFLSVFMAITPLVLAIEEPAVMTANNGLSDHNPAIEQLNDFNKKLKTLHAQFSQTIFDAKGKQTQKAYGQAWLQRPGTFRWDYTAPYQQELVSDGKNFWLYDTDLDQVTVKPLDEALGNAPIFLLMKEGVLQNRFITRAMPKQGDTEWVELTPREQDTDYVSVAMGLKNGIIAQMQLQDAFGQTTVIEFSGVVMNQNVDNDLFQFTPPADADMVGTPAP